MLISCFEATIAAWLVVRWSCSLALSRFSVPVAVKNSLIESSLPTTAVEIYKALWGSGQVDQPQLAKTSLFLYYCLSEYFYFVSITHLANLRPKYDQLWLDFGVGTIFINILWQNVLRTDS